MNTSRPEIGRKPSGNDLFGLVRYRLQVGCLVSPADFVALSPKDHPRPLSTLGKDFEAEVLAGAKELLGDTEAEAGLKAWLEGELDLSTGKGADAKAEAGLGPLALANSAQRNPDADEATVGGELAALRPILFDGEDGCLPARICLRSYPSRASPSASATLPQPKSS
jgi:hypothetical protein